MITLVTANKGDLDENDRARGGDRRKDMFAEAFVPKLIHGQADADEYKTPYIKSELN